MPRSRRDDEIEFGSDSFLDVVANIVGILIILIVVAGIKAGTAPISAERVSEFLRKQAAASVAPPARVAAVAMPAPKKKIISPSPELIRRADELRADVARVERAIQSAQAGASRLADSDTEAKKQVEVVASQLETATAELTRREKELAEAQSHLRAEKAGLVQLEVDVQTAEKNRPTAKTIKHKLTPLSRLIEGKEIHFRLLQDRVAYLPINELTERLRPEIGRHRDRLLRDGIEHGQVGPLAGFRMEYIVRVQRLSVVEELRHGTSVSVGVSDWRLVAEPDLETESAEEALKEGSNFLRALRGADPDATITLWVYPDSYHLYRRLQEFAHQENMTVAARPLPFGVPIMGSPHGSKSSGQ